VALYPGYATKSPLLPLGQNPNIMQSKNFTHWDCTVLVGKAFVCTQAAHATHGKGQGYQQHLVSMKIIAYNCTFNLARQR